MLEQGTSSEEECSYHNEVQQRGAFLGVNHFNGIKVGFIIDSECCDGHERRNSPSVKCPQFSAEHHLVLLVKGHCRTTQPLFPHTYAFTHFLSHWQHCNHSNMLIIIF